MNVYYNGAYHGCQADAESGKEWRSLHGGDLIIEISSKQFRFRSCYRLRQRGIRTGAAQTAFKRFKRCSPGIPDFGRAVGFPACVFSTVFSGGKPKGIAGIRLSSELRTNRELARTGSYWGTPNRHSPGKTQFGGELLARFPREFCSAGSCRRKR